ncbi:MAG: hypothetical protein C0507_01345 [Cyanobacteria bacterium PR.3.49]|nr:hypothetical protein [Cyanobacteria bacterium PR.3.49]
MSVRIRAVAATCILSLCLFQLPAFSQQLTKEEEVAAQNFNGIDITVPSPAGQNNSMMSPAAGGQNFNQVMSQNAFGNSMMQNGLQSNLNNQNTQLGQVGMFNNGQMNTGMPNQFTNGMNMGAGNMPGMSGGMQNNFNQNQNSDFMGNAMGANFNGAMQGNCNSGMNSGMSNGGGIVQSIGNSIMSDPKLMQRAAGVAGAAALLGVFVGNGGIGGMMRSAGIDNTRHIRGSVVGY